MYSESREKGTKMYLFVSPTDNPKLKNFKKLETTADYIVAPTFKEIWKKVMKYADKYAYPEDEPKGVWKLDKRYMAVVERYCGDVIGYIYKV